VTVYLNYTGDNSGMLLNPQKFRSLMPSVFGPDECHTVLRSIINSCVNCAFRSTSVIDEINDVYQLPEDEEKDSYTQIKCMYKNIVLIK
jgi:hypothetical protein